LFEDFDIVYLFLRGSYCCRFLAVWMKMVHYISTGTTDRRSPCESPARGGGLPGFN
jgi:hypothetical protein